MWERPTPPPEPCTPGCCRYMGLELVCIAAQDLGSSIVYEASGVGCEDNSYGLRMLGLVFKVYGTRSNAQMLNPACPSAG